MTNEQSRAALILFDIVCSLEPRLKPLAGWYQEVVKTIDKWSNSEGNQGIKRAKDALNQGWLKILGEDTQELAFVKATGGIPDLVRPLVDRMSKLHYDVRLLSAVSTLIRVTDLWVGRPQDSTLMDAIRVINDSQVPASAKGIIEEFNQFVPSFLDRYPKHPITKNWDKALHLTEKDFARFSLKSGPNGKLTENAHRDVKSLVHSTTSTGEDLFSRIVALEQGIIANSDTDSVGAGNLTDFRDLLLNWEGFNELEASETPGKLSLKQEKSGKLRLVASPDYFTQEAMHPIYEWCKDVLYAFESDCTADQRSAIPKIVAWHKDDREVYSFDQSSCTDLFPFELQLTLIRNRFGDAVTESVKTVMSDRDWSIKLPSGVSKKVRWSVGQPMGMYGSWHLMALTHHLLVQYCYWKTSGKKFPKGDKPFDSYVICGDDIVIGSKSVADYYYKVIGLLGMKVNRTKSHISGGTTGVPPVSEFAKITIWKGQPLFPIRPNMVLSSVKDWRNAPTLFYDIGRAGGWKAGLNRLTHLIKKHWPKAARFLIPLLTIPLELGGCGFRDSVSLRKRFTLVNAREIHPWLWFLCHKIRSGLVLEQQLLYEVPHDLVNQMPIDAFRKHPAILAQRRYEQSLKGRDKLGFETIPTTLEIAQDVLESGWGPYDRFLTNIKEGWIPSDTTTPEQKANRRIWEAALYKPHFFPENTVVSKVSMESFLKLMSEEDISKPDLIYKDRMENRQYDLTSMVMLATRSDRRQSEN